MRPLKATRSRALASRRTIRRFGAIAFLSVFLAAPAFAGAVLSGVPADDLRGKIIVGYQGWFDCPGDGRGGSKPWGHWFMGAAGPDRLHADFLPETGEYDHAGVCATPLRRRSDGAAINLFTPMNADVVKTQFRWMAQNSIDGAAVQRFAMDFKDSPTEHHDDVVLQNVRAAAEATGRVFYLTYDVSGMKDAVVGDALRKDWRHLVNDLHVTSSPRYLRYRGKPVLQIWGYGFSDGHRPIDPVRAAALISDLKRGRAGLEAVTLVGGVPSHWRTLDGDSVRDPRWAAVYRSFDVISPWSVGRFANQTGADNFLRDRVIPDMAAARRAGVDYMPVIFPGYSFHNASRLGEFGGWFRSVIAGFFFPLNEIPRECGRFYWRQVYNLLGAHATILYAAMFDEVDEGTALFKTVRRQGDLPRDVGMVSLDEEGCSLPSDWYLQLTGRAGDALKSGRMPSVSLAMPTERSKR